MITAAIGLRRACTYADYADSGIEMPSYYVLQRLHILPHTVILA